MAQKWPKITPNSPKMTKIAQIGQKWPKIAKMAQKWPKIAQKLAPAKKDSRDISPVSPTFCISAKTSTFHVDWLFQRYLLKRVSHRVGIHLFVGGALTAVTGNCQRFFRHKPLEQPPTSRTIHGCVCFSASFPPIILKRFSLKPSALSKLS